VTDSVCPVILPQALDGEPHVRMRRMLNRYFSPAVVRTLPLRWHP